MFHFRPISLSRGVAATAVFTVLFGSCSDLTVPSNEWRSLADLLILSQRANAPAPAAADFWISNARSSVERLNHRDDFNTLYLELSFPAGCLVSRNGVPFNDSDSVRVTVDPRAGAYGFTLSPSGLVFSSVDSPTATFSFAVYGDASSGVASPNYANASEFVSALEIWKEISVDEWEISPGSAAAGIDAVSAAVRASGRFLLAAPR